jgi:hypothetical protein
VYSKENSTRRERSGIRKSFTLVTIRNNTLFTHASFYFLISRTMSATLANKEGTKIVEMATKASLKLRP